MGACRGVRCALSGCQAACWCFRATLTGMRRVGRRGGGGGREGEEGGRAALSQVAYWQGLPPAHVAGYL